MGTPIQMYDRQGNKTWDCTFDIYGKVINFNGKSLYDCPFRFQGQYEDAETGLYYNRFRYYNPQVGCYLNQDPIKIFGDNPTLYCYVHNSNIYVYIFGLYTYESKLVNGRTVYQNNEIFTLGKPEFIDSSVNPYTIEKINKGYTNLDLMKEGISPIGIDGKQINLHHLIGVEPGSLVEVLSTLHKKYHRALHNLITKGNSFRNNPSLERKYQRYRRKYWKKRAKDIQNNINNKH